MDLQKIYTCHICNKNYKHRQSLYNHNKKFHSQNNPNIITYNHTNNQNIIPHNHYTSDRKMKQLMINIFVNFVIKVLHIIKIVGGMKRNVKIIC